MLQPPIALVCGAVFALLVRLRVCRKPVRRYDVGARGPGGAAGGGADAISISLPGVEPSHDTERRRQIALRALSERLNRGATPPPLVQSAAEAAAAESPAAAARQPPPQEAAPLLSATGDAAGGSGWPNLEEKEDAAPSVHVPVEQAAASARDPKDGVKTEALIDIEGGGGGGGEPTKS